MIDSLYYFSENNNHITVSNILVYNSKRTTMSTVNCHVICKREFDNDCFVPFFQPAILSNQKRNVPKCKLGMKVSLISVCILKEAEVV